METELSNDSSQFNAIAVAIAPSSRSTEWPTVALLVAFFAAWLAVVLLHESIPWPFQVAVLVPLGGLWMSLGHELLHGHPTRWNWVNAAVGSIPLSLWLPFRRYKALHIKHHLSDLTSPEDDPESFYVAPPSWHHAGPWRRRYFLFLRTIPGRLTLGVLRGVVRFWSREIRLVRGGGMVGPWVSHLVACAALGWWLFGIVGFNPVVYVVGFCLGGASCTQLRSFVEHAAVAEGTRSAVVKASPPMALLYLNNNLHHTHHALPQLAWYRIPALHLEIGADEIADKGAGLYSVGYLEVVRTYFFKPFCQPDHPLSPGALPY
ncbi:MAG: fatty acid desaturase [Ilumatobacteraceae bacterium]|nr:fatty acid desaturase [Ilumatobacteraceae bacterium]